MKHVHAEYMHSEEPGRCGPCDSPAPGRRSSRVHAHHLADEGVQERQLAKVLVGKLARAGTGQPQGNQLLQQRGLRGKSTAG